MNQHRNENVFESVKNGLVATIEGTGDVVKAVVDTTAITIATTMRGAGKTGVAGTEAITDVARGVIHGVTEMGSDIGQAAQGAVIGVLRGTKETGTEAMHTIGKTPGEANPGTRGV